jgi:RNA polymerase sigma-70 factor (ECF subfamily)
MMREMADLAGGGAFEDVLASARAGDDSAFASLWRWLHPPLRRWLAVVVPGGTDDVESEVWLSVIRGLASFVGDDRDFRGWVFTIARRRSVDWGRHRERQPLISALDGIDIADPATLSSALVDRTTAVEAALGLLQRLTPDQREVVALRVITGMSVPETAAVVNKSAGAVRVLCHRGLRALAQQLAAEQVTDGVTA